MSELLNNRVPVRYTVEQGTVVPFTYYGSTQTCVQPTENVSITPDGHVYIGGIKSSQPMTLEAIQEMSKILGLEFREETHAELSKRAQSYARNTDLLFALLGKHPTPYKNAEWVKKGNLMVEAHPMPYITPAEVYRRKEIGAQIERLISSARRWIHRNMRSFKRVHQIDDWTAVQLWEAAGRSEIIRHKLGDEVKINQYHGISFGVGSWGRYETWGILPKEDQIVEEDGQFSVHRYSASGPFAVYCAKGDNMNGGTVHYRFFHIIE